MPETDRSTGALSVVGQLMVEMGGASVRVEARGDRIVVRLSSLREGLAILGRWPGVRGHRQAIGRIHDALTRGGLTLQVDIGASTVAVLGAGARAGLASRAFGVGPVEVRVGGLLGSIRTADDASGP